MAKVYYAVTATLPTPELADAYIRWLEDGHIDAVLGCGAHSAMIVRLERSPGDGLPDSAYRVMAQYLFSTRELFDHYVEHHAPALRAEGLRLFGSDRGVSFERRIGEVQ